MKGATSGRDYKPGEHIPVGDRGPGVYAIAAADARMNYFTAYVRYTRPATPEQIASLRNFGLSLLPPKDVDAIMRRVADQEDLYS